MNHCLRALLASGAAAVSTAAFAQLTLPVSDSFPSTGPQLTWEDYADVAYMTGKVIPYTPTAPSGDGHVFDVNDGSGYGVVYLTNDTGNLSHYKITAYVYVPASDGTNWSRVGIISRAQTNSALMYRPKGYYLTVDTDGNNYARCFAMNDDNVWTEAYAVASIDSASFPGVPVTGTHTWPGWLKLELEVTGTSLKAEIDDVEIANATTSLWGPGRIGIYNYRATSTAPSTLVDRITVESTAPASVKDWTLY